MSSAKRSDRFYPTLAQSDLLWSRVKKGEPEECWLWTGSTNQSGYGQMKINGKNRLPHRITYCLATGDAYEGDYVVRHDCDNPACVNPRHLRPGTHQQNTLDMFGRCRHPIQYDPEYRARMAAAGYCRGEKSPRASLRDAQIEDILRMRIAGRSIKSIAEELGVRSQVIQQVVAGKTWAHVKTHLRELAQNAMDGRRKLTRDQVRHLKQRVFDGASPAEVAVKMDISPSLVSMIARGKWRSDVAPELTVAASPNRKKRLTDESIRNILTEAAEGAKYGALAAKYGISASYCWQLVNGQCRAARL